MKTRREVMRKVKIDPADDTRYAAVMDKAAALAPNILGKRYLTDEQREARKTKLAETVRKRAERAAVLLDNWERALRRAKRKVAALRLRVKYYRDKGVISG